MTRRRVYENDVIAAEAGRCRAHAASRQRSQSLRDIAPIPAVENQSRRESCKNDLKLFLETYFPLLFTNEWSPAHLELIKALQNAVLYGESTALVLPRGLGKSTVSRCAVLWALLYGYKRYVILIGASQDAANNLLKQLKAELMYNPLLGGEVHVDEQEHPDTAGDFPAVCYPLRRIGNAHARAAGQIFHGQSTRTFIGNSKIILPTIPDSIASGSVVEAVGLTGEVRGRNETTSAGSLRPDFLILDDVQTDASAKSLTQTNDRYALVNGALKGLSSVDAPIGAVATLTVINPDDLADRLIKSPHWRTVKYGIIDKLPEGEQLELWTQHNEVRLKAIKDGKNDEQVAKLCNAFYKKNKVVLEKGLKPLWKAFKDPSDASPLQKIMRLYFDDYAAFVSEYMNEPSLAISRDGGDLTIDQLNTKVNHYSKRTVPLDCNYITAGFDSQTLGIYYTVTAWTAEGKGYIIEYGRHPGGKETITQRYAGESLEQALYYGYIDLMATTYEKQYQREDGAVMRIDKALIDVGHGATNAKLLEFIRDYNNPDIMPSYGRATSPNAQLFHKRKPGELRGDGWSIPPARWAKDNNTGHKVAGQRYVLIDTNLFKSRVKSLLQARAGAAPGLTVYDAVTHKEYFEHLTAENSKPLTGQYGTIDQWTLKPNRKNHWWDTLVYATCAASIVGVFSATNATAQQPKNGRGEGARKRVRVSASELQNQRKNY